MSAGNKDYKVAAINVLISLQTIAQMLEEMGNIDSSPSWRLAAQEVSAAWQRCVALFGIEQAEYEKEWNEVERDVNRVLGES